jgi:hypothetical protein
LASRALREKVRPPPYANVNFFSRLEEVWSGVRMGRGKLKEKETAKEFI